MNRHLPLYAAQPPPYAPPRHPSGQFDWSKPDYMEEQHVQVMNLWLASGQGTMGELKGCGGCYPGNGERGDTAESKDIWSETRGACEACSVPAIHKEEKEPDHECGM